MGHARKSPSLAQNGASPNPGRERELESALVKEQTERLKAEAKIKDINNEVEELSQNLFQEANEMVASERKTNAGLVERIKRLEQDLEQRQQEQQSQANHKRQQSSLDSSARKENARLRERIQFLEQRDANFAMKLEAMKQRDAERKRRLERLEAASKRIERVRTMLIPR